MITELAFKKMIEQLRNLEPGKQVIYHVGVLTNDKVHDNKLNNIWAETQYLERRGRVHLLQRRVDANIYCYIAVGRDWKGKLRDERDESFLPRLQRSPIFQG